MEKQVREQMEERLRNHEMRNEERKLTPEQRSKKHAKKWQVGKNDEIEAALFTLKSLDNPKMLFKVDVNAQQFHLTGCCIVASHAPSIVVVEGESTHTSHKTIVCREQTLHKEIHQTANAAHKVGGMRNAR